MNTSLVFPQKFLYRVTPVILPRNFFPRVYYSSPSLSPTPNSNIQVSQSPQNPQIEELRPVFRTVYPQNGNRNLHPISNRDWRDRLLTTYNFRTVMNSMLLFLFVFFVYFNFFFIDRKVESFLYSWRHDWTCYWDQSDVPLDPNKDCISLPPFTLFPLFPPF